MSVLIKVYPTIPLSGRSKLVRRYLHLIIDSSTRLPISLALCKNLWEVSQFSTFKAYNTKLPEIFFLKSNMAVHKDCFQIQTTICIIPTRKEILSQWIYVSAKSNLRIRVAFLQIECLSCKFYSTLIFGFLPVYYKYLIWFVDST